MARSAPKRKKVCPRFAITSYAVLALVLCALCCAEDDYRLLHPVQLSIASASSSMPVSPPPCVCASGRMPRTRPPRT